MLSRCFKGVRACSAFKLTTTTLSRPARLLSTTTSFRDDERNQSEAPPLAKTSLAESAKTGHGHINSNKMAMAGRSGPPTTSPAASDNSEKGTNTKAGPPVTAISDVFPGVWAMRYLLTGQLDRLARLDEILFPHQISNVALTDPKQAPLFSTTEHIKEEKHGSGNSKLELSPSPNEEVKDDVHGKTLDNPVGIALRALVDENGLGNYVESEERAVSCFRLGL